MKNKVFYITNDIIDVKDSYEAVKERILAYNEGSTDSM